MPWRWNLRKKGQKLTRQTLERQKLKSHTAFKASCRRKNVPPSKKGDLPKDDATVKGTLEMDIAFEDDPKQVKRTLGEILRTETTAKFVGCEKRRVRHLIEDTGTEEEDIY